MEGGNVKDIIQYLAEYLGHKSYAKLKAVDLYTESI